MPTDHRLHQFEAKSGNVRISRDEPKVARVDFQLGGGEFLTVRLSRLAVERLVGHGQRALREAPLPARGRSIASRSASGRNK
jgi:hypothetical protein